MGSTYGWFYTYNSTGDYIRVRYIQTTKDLVAVEGIGSDTVNSSGKYGINGTFFSTTQALGIAINNGQVIENGDDNSGYNRGTLYCTDSGIVKAEAMHDKSELDLSNNKWAIGGISLYVEKNYTETEYYTAIEPEYSSQSGIGPKEDWPRTAMGYDGTNIWLVTVLDRYDDTARNGLNFWDLRHLMQANFACDWAIALDGGGSTAIAYKKDGSRQIVANEARSVRTMVTVPGSSFLKINC